MNAVSNVVSDVQDTAEMAVGVATMPTFIGGIGGIIVGATLGGFVASKLSFSGRITNLLGAGGQFLIGAALYGVGLSGRVRHPAMRSATQVSGVVIAGMGLGKLLASLGVPTFGLGAEGFDRMGLPDPDDGRIIGQDYNGRLVGQAAEDGPLADPNVFGEFVNDGQVIGQGFEGQVLGQDAEDAPSHSATGDHDYDPLSRSSPPKWSKRGHSSLGNPLEWQIAENSGIMMPSSPMGGVDQWYGSAEGGIFGNGSNFIRTSNSGYVGNMVHASEGLGSVVGQ